MGQGRISAYPRPSSFLETQVNLSPVVQSLLPVQGVALKWLVSPWAPLSSLKLKLKVGSVTPTM